MNRKNLPLRHWLRGGLRLIAGLLVLGLASLLSAGAADAQTINIGPNGNVTGTLPNGMGTFSGTIVSGFMTVRVFGPTGQFLGTVGGDVGPGGKQGFSGFFATEAGPALGDTPLGEPTVCIFPTGGGKFHGSCGILTGNLPLFGAVSSVLQPALRGAASASTREQSEAVIYGLDDYIRHKSHQLAQAKGGTQSSDAPTATPSGISAGSDDKLWTIWTDGSASRLTDTSGVATYGGSTITSLFGIDYTYGTDWLFGFSAGYVNTDLRIAQIGGHRLSEGGVLGPYVSYIYSDHVTFDAILNYGRLENEAINVIGFGSNRYSGSLAVNGFTTLDSFQLTGSFAYTTASEIPDSGSASLIGGEPTRLYLSAFKLSGEISYPIGNFEPYIPLAFILQTNQTHDGTGNYGFMGGAGLRYQLTDRIKAGAQLIGEARSHAESWGGDLNVRVTF